MCGRYELQETGKIVWRFNVRNTVTTLLPNVDVRPSQLIPVIAADHRLELMKWGLVPHWAKDSTSGARTINARAETIATKPSFKRPLRQSRCLVPASAFFEWQGDRPGHKTKYRIARNDGDLFGFAELYDTWTSPSGDELTTCTIITTTPNAVLAPIHDRMPVILFPDEEDEWLNPDLTEPEQLLPFLRPYPGELLQAKVA
jgi:putative SOS response-associated peptidase YedK